MLLCLCMVAALLPTTVFADGDVNYNTQFDAAAGGEIYTNSSTASVTNGSMEATTFELTQKTKITAIFTYHWNVDDFGIDLSEQTIKLKTRLQILRFIRETLSQGPAPGVITSTGLYSPM